MNYLLSLGQSAFGWTLENSLRASVLIALILFLRRLLGGRLTAGMRQALSLLALAGLLLPIAPASPLSLANFLPRAPIVSTSLRDPPGSVMAPGAMVRGPTRPSPQGLSQAQVASLIWATGAAVLLAIAAWRHATWLARTRSGRRVTDPNMLALLESAKEQMGVRRPVDLMVVDQVASPAVFGLCRVQLLLPPNLQRQLVPAELRMVYLHELAHIKGNDLLLNWVLLAAQFLHWFNPLVWLALRRLRGDRELVCDAMVLRTVRAEDHVGYGKVLVKLLEGFRGDAGICASALPVIGSHREVKQRILMIKHHRRASLLGSLGMGLVLAALGCATLTRAREDKPEAKDHTLVIAIDAEGNFRLGPKGTLTSLDRLPEELNSAVAKTPDLKLAIRADKLAPFSRIVKVMDAAKASNVPRVVVASDPDNSPRRGEGLGRDPEDLSATMKLGTNVAKINIQHVGPAWIADESIRSNISLAVGHPFSLGAVDDDVRRLYATGNFYNIRVTTDTTPEGLVANYVVQGNPRVKAIRFTGNHRFTEAQLLRRMSSKAGGVLRERELFGDTQIIKQMYDDVGLKQAHSKFLTEIDEATGEATVTFQITEERGGAHLEAQRGSRAVASRIQDKRSSTEPDSAEVGRGKVDVASWKNPRSDLAQGAPQPAILSALGARFPWPKARWQGIVLG